MIEAAPGRYVKRNQTDQRQRAASPCPHRARQSMAALLLNAAAAHFPCIDAEQFGDAQTAHRLTRNLGAGGQHFTDHAEGLWRSSHSGRISGSRPARFPIQQHEELFADQHLELNQRHPLAARQTNAGLRSSTIAHRPDIPRPRTARHPPSPIRISARRPRNISRCLPTSCRRDGADCGSTDGGLDHRRAIAARKIASLSASRNRASCPAHERSAGPAPGTPGTDCRSRRACDPRSPAPPAT